MQDITLQAKDLGLAVAAAEEVGLKCPLASEALHM